MCGKADLACHVATRVTRGFTGLLDQQLNFLKERIGELVQAEMKAVCTFWMQDTPSITGRTPDGGLDTGTAVGFMQHQTVWLVAVLAVVSVLFAGIRLAWEQRADPLRDLGKALLMLIVVAGAGTAFVQTLTSASDEFAKELVVRAIELPPQQVGAGHGAPVPEDREDVEQFVKQQREQQAADAFEQQLGGWVIGSTPDRVPLMATLMFGSLAAFAGLAQLFLLVIRWAMLLLLVGTFPLAAAATNTEAGKQWFRKHCGWTLALIAYKPAAALVYAAAIKSAGTALDPNGSLTGLVVGLMLILLAVLAMPAMVRFIVPAAAAAAGGGVGIGAGMAAGTLTAGRNAIAKRQGRGGGGGGGGGDGGGATGAVSVGPAGGGMAGGVFAAASAVQRLGGAVAHGAAHSAGEPSAGGGPAGAGSTPVERRRDDRRSGKDPNAGQENQDNRDGPTGNG